MFSITYIWFYECFSNNTWMGKRRQQVTNHLLNIRNPHNSFAHTKDICFSLCTRETVWLVKTRISVPKLIPLHSSPSREGCSLSDFQRAKNSLGYSRVHWEMLHCWSLRNENYNCKANTFRKYIQKVTLFGWEFNSISYKSGRETMKYSRLPY